ncbi:uncharacterized protein M6B38_370880 [Iris pallida]|uniref:Fungal lipase-type domain-containing protein n=1 Tax=Iris pallida TaxID=29817 RepID=A0AAX6GF28_IRIPA|nr:uncharacterized protein M6B38_370880 [Iris pallida]
MRSWSWWRSGARTTRMTPAPTSTSRSMRSRGGQGARRVHEGAGPAEGRVAEGDRAGPSDPLRLLRDPREAEEHPREEPEGAGGRDRTQLGRALSALFPVVLKLHGEDGILERIKGVYTFGQPRVGDGQLGKFAESILDSPKRRYFRFVYSNDLVPRVPFDDNTWLFKHFGKCLYYDSMYRGQEVHEEPNENYFASEYFIPKHLDATWELARSFGIGHVRGPDYHESLMMRMMRAMGLLIPGLPCHSPQDYNNLTRLGTLMSTAIDNSD